MNTFTTDAIVIARTDYGDADRIYTFLTPQHGKVEGIAKGIKKPKSRLAGGLQLFSVCSITFLAGRGSIHTVMSSRLKKHFGNLTKDLGTTNAAYEMLKISQQLTHDAHEPEYFSLLASGLESLDAHSPDFKLSRLWFLMHFLRAGGHSPNFETDNNGEILKEGDKYVFDAPAMQFAPVINGDKSLTTNHIKLLRLAGSLKAATSLYKINDTDKLLPGAEAVVKDAFITVHRFQVQV